ncbi:MAG: hypothetical protein A2945_03540 [Candidatus Liptonbacteria bacterium RIFCSPLOWO2_01_FULL_52_25]|uniref:alanine--tRNA ligase n=1 Tax=Candidatus Liptonbacteria bacterium RIFCSPLOWO2_01_FULL_52_25 TaxID=1798650 RepID=A0A1G2CG68_9BACT|nr:MAG: hypothetical protein A2945_03540 [Candidatus Liptonbacteria bacterium RIFCSPLOWO2_01_FULL_52_25]
MTSAEIRKKFRAFFEHHGHTWVDSSSLVPDDPSVLLTTAGMQQFKKYYTGELDAQKDFGKKSTASIQKCFRTSDIDEVGDESHLTFFEMLGNFSFGGYWKEEAIKLGHKFITKEMGLKISYVSVFRGEHGVSEDKESEKIWKSLGVTDVRKEGMEDVFWGPTGTAGPCGPTTEVYVNSALRQAQGKLPTEVWNIVFNEFLCDGSRDALLKGEAKLKPLAVKGIDTGMGFERLAMVSQGVPNIFETDLFKPVLGQIVYPTLDTTQKSERVLADHVRGSVFLAVDGVRPSNKGTGYILRRLVRRAALHARKLTREDEGGGFQLGKDLIRDTAKSIISLYGGFYPELKKSEDTVLDVLNQEYKKFSEVFYAGLREFDRLHRSGSKHFGDMPTHGFEKILGNLSGKDAFHIYQSFGLPREVMRDICAERGIQFDDSGFDEEFKKHQEISRAGQEKKFGGHGLVLNTGELKAGNEEELKKVLRLHTATHLLQGALREVLGNEVHQAGSDITVERTRFDFSFPRKVTPEEIKKVEEIVNQKVKEDLPVGFKEMPKAEAEKIGALHFFKEKYPEKVKVYFVGKTLESAWSKEFCGGPHVTHTGVIGKFKILKEEAVGAGTRRIRATVE